MTRRWLPTALLILLLAPTLVGAAGNCSAYRSWNTGDTLTASDLTQAFVVASTTNSTPQCLDDYSQDATQMRSTVDPYPAGVESLATSTAGELERLRHVIQRLTGWSQWYAHTEHPALQNFNYTFNGDVEVWGEGTSQAPTGWTASCPGTGVSQNTTNTKISAASVNLVYSSDTCLIRQDVDLLPGFGPAARWQGRTVTLGAWVRATVANRARLAIDDGVGTSFSAYHAGDAAFAFLTVTRTLDAAATRLRIQAQVDTGATTAQVDGLVLVAGGRVSDFLPSGWRGRKSALPIMGLIGERASAVTRMGAVPSGSTVYLGSGTFCDSPQCASVPVPFNGVVRRLRVKVTAAPGAGQTFTYTVMKNTVATAITCTIADASTDCSDTANEVLFSAADYYTVRLVLSASASTIQAHNAGLELEEVP